jgi:hypothetical protein
MRRLLALALVAGALVLPSQAAAADERRLEVRVSGTVARAMAGCRGIDVARIGRSALGFVVYKFHVVKRWCWSFPRVTSVTTYAYASDIDPNWDYKGVIAANGYFYRWCCGVGRSGHYSVRQAKFENCVFTLGCVRREYPWVKIRVHGDGGYRYTTGV